jgi:hypothetical protein
VGGVQSWSRLSLLEVSSLGPPLEASLIRIEGVADMHNSTLLLLLVEWPDANPEAQSWRSASPVDLFTARAG